MPTDHRGNKVGGPSGNCANCNAASTKTLESGASLCDDCYSDYMSYLPWMWEKSMKPKWDTQE